MTTERSVAQLVEVLDDLAGSGRTDYVPAILARTGTTRQRPGWHFPTRWIPSLPHPFPGWAGPARSRALVFLLVAALLLAAVALAAFVGRRQQLHAPFGPAGNGSIAFARDGELYIAHAPDATPRLLVGGPESDNIPLFSPLGDRLAFLRHPDPAGTFGDFFLMAADADGSSVRRLGGPISGLNGIAWGPDGTTVAFGHSVESVPRIVLYPTDRGTPTVLDLGVPAEWPAWRPPDGREIAFLGLVDGRWSVHLAESDGTDARDLGLVGTAPSWSPDGRHLVFDHGGALGASPTPNRQLHVAEVSAAGRVVSDRAIEFDARNDAETGAVWSPDGRRLAFVRGRGGRFVVAVGRPDGSGYREIGIETGPEDASLNSVWFWSPDGRFVLQTFDNGETWTFDPDGGPPRRAALSGAAFSNWQRVAP